MARLKYETENGGFIQIVPVGKGWAFRKYSGRYKAWIGDYPRTAQFASLEEAQREAEAITAGARRYIEALRRDEVE